MGFCSGTEIFDPVVKAVLSESAVSDSAKERIIKALIEALRNHDWDCESDSDFWDDPIIRRIWRELEPEMFEEDE